MSDPIAAKRCPACDRYCCWACLSESVAWRARALTAEAERDEWARHYSAANEAAAAALASEVAAWKARAETAERDAADTHRQCRDCRAARRLEPTRIAAAVADERRKVIGEVVAWIADREAWWRNAEDSLGDDASDETRRHAFGRSRAFQEVRAHFAELRMRAVAESDGA